MFPSEPYLTFIGAVDLRGIQQLVAALTRASQEDVRRLHLLFHSTAGFAAEGVLLYAGDVAGTRFPRHRVVSPLACLLALEACAERLHLHHERRDR